MCDSINDEMIGTWLCIVQACFLIAGRSTNQLSNQNVTEGKNSRPILAKMHPSAKIIRFFTGTCLENWRAGQFPWNNQAELNAFWGQTAIQR